MRFVLSASIGLTMLLGCFSLARGAQVKSGPQIGDELGAFQVVKAAGATDDGVKEGDQLCYRCKLGNRPVVMVFARKADSHLGALVKQLDEIVAKNQDKKMGSFVNLLGDKPDDLRADAKKFAADNKVEHVALVVPEDSKNGPGEYNIDPKAEFTVLIYRQGKIAANHALAAGELTSGEIEKIVADTSKILE